MKAARWVWLPLLLLSGCGDSEIQDLEDFVRDSGKNMRGKIEAPPEVKPYEPFIYDNSGNPPLPDPFRPRKTTKKPTERKGLSERLLKHKLQELEGFPLESLKMVGYLYKDRVAHGVISAPDGKLRYVTVGNFMGQNFGEVISITETEIKLKETVEDSTGDFTERTSTLQLIE